MHSEMALQSVLSDSEGKMLKLSMYKFKAKVEVRMDYSCHGRFKGIYLVYSLFSLHSS